MNTLPRLQTNATKLFIWSASHFQAILLGSKFITEIIAVQLNSHVYYGVAQPIDEQTLNLNCFWNSCIHLPSLLMTSNSLIDIFNSLIIINIICLWVAVITKNEKCAKIH